MKNILNASISSIMASSVGDSFKCQMARYCLGLVLVCGLGFVSFFFSFLILFYGLTGDT